MNAEPAIRGLLVGHARDYADNSMVLSVKIERLQFASFAPAVGVPDANDPQGHLPSVMLIACRAPTHPEDDGDVMVQAAFAFLDDRLQRRTEPPTAELAEWMRGLIASFGDLQLRHHREQTP